MINDNIMQSTPSKNEQNDVKQISLISPEKSRQDIWPICVKCIKKSHRECSKFGTPYFKVQLQDQSGNIEALAYKDNVDEYYDQLVEGKKYFLENGTIQKVNHGYQNVGNEWEIILEGTTITACDEEIRPTPIQLTTFEDASKLEPQSDNPINLMGLLLETGPLETRVVKDRETDQSAEIDLRVITLMDINKVTLDISLWGLEAKKFSQLQKTDLPILFIQGVRVEEKYMGEPQFSTVNSSVFRFYPEIPEIKELEPLVRKFGFTNVNEVRRNLFSETPESGDVSDDTKMDQNGANALVDTAAIKVEDTMIVKTEEDEDN